MKKNKRILSGWIGDAVEPGESRDLDLVVSESYSGRDVIIPVHVRRAKKAGPKVFVTGALHGDELNGTGAARSLLVDDSLTLLQGTLVVVPVLNMLGFERHERYLPDRRDLNRCFPGNSHGSMAKRFAKRIFDSLIRECDYGIDLHTAALRRTNFPNVRGDLSNPNVMQLAKAFGIGILLNSAGPEGSLRREATNAGCPTIVIEGGEVWKFEPSVVDCMLNGVKNCLRFLLMLEGAATLCETLITIERSMWIRAERGGFLEFHVSPGDVVTKGQPIATNSNLLSREHSRLEAPFDGVIIGMTTLPAVQPGEPVVNLGRLNTTARNTKSRQQDNLLDDDLHRAAHEHLSAVVTVSEPSTEHTLASATEPIRTENNDAT